MFLLLIGFSVIFDMARLIALFRCPLLWAINLGMALLQTCITFECLLPWVNFTFVYYCGKVFANSYYYTSHTFFYINCIAIKILFP